MHSPSQPAPPDPAIQTSNEAAANRYDINSPFGTQTWSTGGRQVIGYDSKNQPIYGQQQTQNITLNPSEQRQFDLRNQISEQLMKGGQQGIEQGLPDYTAQPGLPQTPSDMGNFDINAASSPAADAQFKRTMDYVQPYFERQNAASDQQLVNQGLPVGSAAYADAKNLLADQQNRTISDAASGAAAMAPQIALQGRQQQMGEVGQNYGQTMGERQQLLGQDLSKRQEYYNEIAAALGGQQLNPINAGGGGGDSALNVSGAYNAYNQGVMNNYNQQQASQNAMLEALIGAGGKLGAAGIASDERVKHDIEPVGELASGDDVYSFRYDWDAPDEPKHIGVMAQDIEKVDPEAVLTGADGIKRVNYRRVLARALLAA